MKQWIKMGVPVAMGLIGLSASAATLTGQIQMNGSVTFDSGDLSQVTTATFVNPAATVTSGSGTFAGTTGNLVTFNNFTFFPVADQSTPVDPLWTFTTAGLVTYSFNLQSIATVSRSSTLLDITGSGDVNITGVGDLDALWEFTVNNAGGMDNPTFTFAFDDSNTSIVPDGGTTMMLLGAALTGLGLIKRKLVA